MISYCIQSVVTLIFGPLLALSVIIYDLDITAIPDRRFRALKLVAKMSQSTQQANILVALSVTIASLIRIKQLAPLAEIDFIKLLGPYQFVIALGASLSYFATAGRVIPPAQAAAIGVYA